MACHCNCYLCIILRYLELLLCHPVLGKNQRLHDFLTEKEPPPRTKVNITIHVPLCMSVGQLLICLEEEGKEKTID